MSNQSANNKRIAKNTILLYFRMLLTMFVSLYTSRVVLQTLGIDDYGIYNVVGGVVAMFSVLSGSLSAAISRFITFELGRNDMEKLKRVFSSAVTIQIALSLLIIILAETIGLWFLNNKMVIPFGRLIAANWVYHFSILTFAINLISIPYNAAIIAHEKMSAFAYISILEVIGKLLVAFTIAISPIDKLIYYGCLLMLIAIIIRMVYSYYCKKHFTECTYQFILDKSLLKQMFGFAGWNFIGASSAVLRDQGGNIVMNLFCGPAVNAARGIAMQVNHAIYGFVANFMTAMNPQITKSYASGDHKYMMTLVFQGARFSFYMLLILSLPVIVNAPYILKMWLGIVPEHTAHFVQLVLLFAMSESISTPLITAMLATGKIRNYQLIVGGLQMMNLPISYFCLKAGFMPECVIIIAIILSQCCLATRLILLKKMIHLPVVQYLKNVYLNVIVVSLVAIFVPLLMHQYADSGFLQFILNSIVCLICTIITIYFIGCTKQERILIKSKAIVLRNKILKI